MMLDETDYAILELLKENGRATYSEMAETVHLSRVAVRDRIRTLRENNVIKGFTVQINSISYGKHVSVFFNLEVDPLKLAEIAQKLAKLPDVSIVSEHTGRSGLHVHALLTDVDYLGAFMEQHLYSQEGIRNVETHILIKHYKTNAYLT